MDIQRLQEVLGDINLACLAMTSRRWSAYDNIRKARRISADDPHMKEAEKDFYWTFQHEEELDKLENDLSQACALASNCEERFEFQYVSLPTHARTDDPLADEVNQDTDVPVIIITKGNEKRILAPRGVENREIIIKEQGGH